jgi:hypothetical protein
MHPFLYYVVYLSMMERQILCLSRLEHFSGLFDETGLLELFLSSRINMKNFFVITIGREFGSGGRQVGQRLAELLHIDFFDKELIEEASRRSGVSTDF